MSFPYFKCVFIIHKICSGTIFFSAFSLFFFFCIPFFFLCGSGDDGSDRDNSGDNSDRSNGVVN